MPLSTSQLQRIAASLGVAPDTLGPSHKLTGGCVGDVHRIDTANGQSIVAKLGSPGSGLDIEGAMLRYLAERSNLPVPEVFLSEDDVLVMAYIDPSVTTDEHSQQWGGSDQHAAKLLAALHDITPQPLDLQTGINTADIEPDAAYGFPFNTLIGGLHQPNPWTSDWITFYRDHRILNFATLARDEGTLPARTFNRIERFAHEHLKNLLQLPANTTRTPSLIHGDCWGGNVIAARTHIAGFIDPALYFADAEIELAFTTMFSTFGPAFFEHYAQHRPAWAPAMPSFFETRRDVYLIYPLLVHVRLFGGGYVGQLDAIVSKHQ